MQGSSGIQPANTISQVQGIMAQNNTVTSVTPTQPITTPPPNPVQSKIQNFNQQATTQKQPGQNLSSAKRKQIENDVNEDNKNNDIDYPITNVVKETVSNINDEFDKTQFTKGLALTFGILIFLVWMLIPTSSGYTRLQLLWFTLFGQTQINQASSGTGQSEPSSQSNDITNGSTRVDLTQNENDGPDMSQMNSFNLSNIDFSALDYNGA